MAPSFRPCNSAESPFVEFTDSDKGSTSAEFSSAINPSSLRCKIVLDSIADSSESKRAPKPIIIPINMFIGIIIGLGALFDSDESAIESNTILHLKLDGLIAEENSAEVDPLSLSVNSTKGLSALLHGLKEGAKDDNIKGLFLEKVL